ncbi:S9 family peptidase [Brevibacillus sp. SYSU BS000544]|uniref:S9 family peptidase n=1 Tax=Brevibacillus sp. SYSU BS000544 TaxID=3416443 RepID=UPI003CE4EBD0
MFMVGMDTEFQRLVSVASINTTSISPDGRAVLFTASQPSEDFSHYKETLYLAHEDGGNTKAVTSEKQNAYAPQWSPDGKFFSAIVEGMIHVYDSSNIQKIAKLHVDGDISLYCWGANDRYLWVVTTHNQTDPDAPFEVGQFGGPTNILTIEIAGGVVETVASEKDGSIIDICRSREGEQLFYAHRENDIYDAGNRINIVDRKTKKNTPIVTEGKISVSNFVGCLADQRIVFAGLDIDPHNASYPRHYFTLCPMEGKVQKLLVPVNRRGNGMEAKVFKEGKDILFREANGSSVLLYTLENHKNYISIEKCVTAFSINDSGQVAFVQQDFHVAPEVFVSDIDSLFNRDEPSQISGMNRTENERKLPHVEVIRWKSFDDQAIEGVLIYPKDYQAGKKYPLLTLTTGRSNSFPRAYLGSPDTLAGRDRFPYPLAMLAEQGYMILCANCRTSNYHFYEYQSEQSSLTVDGYCRNVLDGIDTLISQGLADEEKLGIMGWSLGGYLAARLATWPENQFKVAAIGNAVTDFVSMFETSNCFEFQAFMRGGFWQSGDMFDKYTKASPIRSISNTKAAVLIQHGSKNPSIPVSQGRELYYGLRLAGKTVKLTEYPKAGMVLMNPQYNIHATKEVFDWITDHLPLENK